MKIDPSDATLGAYVSGVRLADLTDQNFAAIERAWHQFGVLIFPEQHLTDEEHLAFSQRFGLLERGLKRTSNTGMGRLSNVAPDGSVVSADHLQRRFQLGNLQWHSDSSYKRTGAKASLLAAHVVPSTGGETEWADQRAAYDALPAARKTELENCIAVHSYRFSHGWHGGVEHLGDDELAALPDVQHPLVRRHPATGRKNLFVGRHASYIVGHGAESSREELRELTEWVGQAPRTLKHHWSPGDLVIWDNRCVLHRGHPWPDNEARVMVRTTVAGAAENGDNEWALQANHS
jgi:alpha-ketoglutarate-dependent taurine dioxygenase